MAIFSMVDRIKNPAVRFFLVAFFLWLLWFLLYENWLHPEGSLDLWMINRITNHGRWLLGLFGLETFDPGVNGLSIRTLGIIGSDGVWIGDPCNGISLFAIFIGFMLAYPGPLRKKLWFIPFGVVSIHLLNVIRVSALATIVYWYPDSLEFNHTYTFTILVYSWVFLLWYYWAGKLSKSEA